MATWDLEQIRAQFPALTREQDGRPVAAYGLSRHYEEIFLVTRLSDFMTMHHDEAAAAASAAE